VTNDELAERPSQTRLAVDGALAGSELSRVATAFTTAGVTPATEAALLAAVTDQAPSRRPITVLAESLAAHGIAPERYGVERLLLLRAAERLLQNTPALRMPASVMVEYCTELKFLAEPEDRNLPTFRAEAPDFPGMTYFVNKRRHPAGQLHFIKSGIPRSWFLKPALKSILPFAAFALRHVGGLHPLYFVHIGWRRRLIMSEREHYRSYYRIAQALTLNPEVRGLFGASWFHSPDTYAVSPHLNWTNRVFEEHGGFTTLIGPAHPTGGVFQNDIHRRRMYDEGTFKPTTGLFVWPRKAMLDWAAKHPEYAT
jgi:hypothetical protein